MSYDVSPFGAPAFRVVCASVVAAGLVLLLPGCGKKQSQENVVSEEELAPFTVDCELKHEFVGSFEAGMTKARGLTVDGKDNLYVAGADGVRVFDPNGSLLRSWRTSGAARSVALGPDGSVYVALLTKIEKYDADGNLLTSWDAAGPDAEGEPYVTAIAVADENVFVADAGGRCIRRFDTTGDFISEIGKRGPEDKDVGLVVPSPFLDCAVDQEGVLYVNNPGRLRVDRYDMNGKLLGSLGRAGMKPELFCGCCNPTNIAPMSDGRVATSEKGIPRVKVYDAQGKMLAYIRSEAFAKNAAGMDLAVDTKGRIYVVDPMTCKIHIFALREK